MVGILLIFGGLALFLWGIRMLSAGMEKVAGEQIQKWLDRVTNGRLKSAAFGAVATALLQSSGLLMVTMIGLINANLMTVVQSISVMLGQEIGTTLTAQIVAFDVGYFRLVLVIAGFVLYEFFPKRDWKKYGEILMGLGIIFVGMSYMSTALDYLTTIPWVENLLIAMGQHPFIGVIAGLVMTAITQSSTAVTSIAVAMGISNVITLEGAIGIILGANIGSCITGLIASVRLSRAARQASVAQILINVFGVLLFLPFITPYADLIRLTSSELPRQIANAHTIFNVAVSALVFPFVKQIAHLSEWLIPDSAKPEKQRTTAYIDEGQFSVPAVAIKEAARELTHMAEITAEMVEDGCMALIGMKTDLIERVMFQEQNIVDPVSKELGSFVNTLIGLDLSHAQQKRCFQIKALIVDVERVGDMAEDIAQYALERTINNVPFTNQAIEELDCLWKHAHQTYMMAIDSFDKSDKVQALQVCRQESEFDRMYWHSRQSHIDRLEKGLCNPEADVIFTETLRILERISDHADNLGVSVSRS
ncbi:MAG: phosphate:Na+ symporter [Chloroflexi bacterium]|nr:phosphate:Na+ symporter [Chloroflexota bacterium]